MKKLLKIFAVAAAFCAVLSVAAAVALRVFLPPEKLKALAIAQADKTLHRQLEVQNVELGLLTGLRIRGLRLSESPDFSKGEFLKAETFIVRPAWLPLLRKEIVARRLELDGASVSVIKGKDGRFNFADLTGAAAPAASKAGGKAKAGKTPVPPAESPSAAPAAPAAKAAPLALAVDSLRLQNVALHYADRQQGAKADVTLNGAAVDGFSLSGPFSVSVDVSADYAAAGKRTALTFKAKGKADLGGGDQSKVSADFSSFALATGGKEVTGSLRLEDAKAPKIVLALSAPALDAGFLNGVLGGEAVPAGVELPAVKAEAELAYAPPALQVSSFKVSAAGAELSGSASVKDVAAKEPAFELKAQTNDFKLGPLFDILPQTRGAGLGGTASLTLAVSGSAGSAELERLELRWGGLDAKVSGTVAGLRAKTPSFALKVVTNKFELASLAEGAEMMKQFGLGGTAALSASVSGTAAAPKASGTLGVEGVAAKYKGQTLEKATGQIQFTQDSVNMPQLTGRLNGGDFKLKVAASNPAAPTLTLSGWLSVLDLGALQKLAGGPASAAAAPAQAAPAARASGGSPAAAHGGGGTAARQAPAAAPALKTSGDITVDKTTHPNFSCGKMTLTWNLTGVTPDMKQLGGAAKLTVGAGQATNLLDFAAARGGLVRAMVVPLEALEKARGLHIPGLNIPEMQNIPFNKIIGNYTASKGMVAMQPFQLDSPVIGMTTTGSVDLGAQTANLKTAIKASIGEIDLAITGPFSNPSIRPNISQQLKTTGQQFLQKQGKAALKQLFGR